MTALRPATEADLPTLRAMLTRGGYATLFAQSNLARHGLGTGPEDSHDHATRFWLDTDREIALGLTRAGMVLPYHPPGADTGRLLSCLQGHRVTGMIGDAGMVRPLLEAMGISAAQRRLDVDTPQMALKLSGLRMPEGPGALSPATAHRETACAWRLGFNRDTNVGAQDAQGAAREVGDWIAEDRLRLLVADGTPRAMTGFNVVLPHIVQVGGVFCPPDHRRRGHASRAVALHLAEARAAGVGEATLFAASDGAAHLYERLGFTHVGQMAIVLFTDPQVLA